MEDFGGRPVEESSNEGARAFRLEGVEDVGVRPVSPVWSKEGVGARKPPELTSEFPIPISSTAVPDERESLLNLSHRTVDVRRPERARNEESDHAVGFRGTPHTQVTLPLRQLERESRQS